VKTPLIGITTYRTTNQYDNPILVLGENYVQAISLVGGLPVLVPLGLPENQLAALIARLDGILFSGGGDIESCVFGMEDVPEVKDVDPDRDRVEIQLVQESVSKGLPFFGICRGLQVINVALGGTLYTHINGQHPQAIEHSYYPDWPRDYLAHAVRVDRDSHLTEILETNEIRTNSMHHQGIQLLATNLKATAWAPDGVIEGIELPDHPFGLAVQWHPEWMLASLPMRALFLALVEAAAK